MFHPYFQDSDLVFHFFVCNFCPFALRAALLTFIFPDAVGYTEVSGCHYNFTHYRTSRFGLDHALSREEIPQGPKQGRIHNACLFLGRLCKCGLFHCELSA